MYDGPGIYKHRKGGRYRVLGLGLREETLTKPGEEPQEDKSEEGVTVVIYYPLTPGSLLEDRREAFWTRPLDTGDEPFNTPGRFDLERQS